MESPKPTPEQKALPDPRLQPTLTDPEAAQYLSVAPRTLYAAIADGEFPSIRIRRRLLVSSEVLIRLLKGQSNG